MKKRLTSTLNNDIMIIPSKPVKAVIKLEINQPLTLINVHRNKDYIMCGKNMEDKLVLKNHLKEIRGEQELSQRQPADMTGVSRNTIGSIEVGEFRPTAKPALVLSSAFDKLNGKRRGLFAPFCLLVAVLVLVLGGPVLAAVLLAISVIAFGQPSIERASNISISLISTLT